MIALGILAVGILGAVRVFPVGLRASQQAERISRATLLAQRTIESLKLKSWDELAAGQTVEQDEIFASTVTIDQPNVEGLVDPAALKRISVTMAWTQQGHPKTLSLMTYVRRPSS